MLRGPASFSVNDECGLLVDGFDTPPTLMMPHNPRYYIPLLERAGFAKAKDLLVYQGGDERHYVPVPERLARGTELIRQRMGITIRPLDMKDFKGEVERIKELYNAAWEKNWGFVPMTDHEIDHLAEQFKPVVIPELVPIAEKDGKVIGFGIALPDLNVVFRSNRSGRLFPMILKLLWALKTRKIRRARILLLGVLPEYRGKGVDAMLYHWIWTRSGDARHLLGRGGLDSRGQSRHERRAREDDLQGLQDLPALRPADMKALVTGATGFVGSHLVEALRRRGDEVTALARSAAKAAALAPLGVRVVPGDLHDRAALQRAVEGQDVIYHVAGVVAARSEAEFMAANRDGTRNVIEAAERAGIARLVLVSSMAAAGPTIKGRPLRGDERPRPVTAYGRSKLAAEAARHAPAGWPGPSCGRRWSTARATWKCSRCSAWPGSGSRPSSATGPRSSPPCTAPTWPTR